MQKIIKHIIFILFTAISSTLDAQIPGGQNQVEELVESVLGAIGEEADVPIVLEDLEAFATNPLNINCATRNQLARLHLLDDIQIDKLLEYRDTYGPVLTIYELNAVDGLHPEILKKMEPFIWFGPPEKEPVTLHEILNYGRHEVIMRSLGTVQKPVGYRAGEQGAIPYQGNRFRYYARYRFQSGDAVSGGITAEKDPGEAFFSGMNPKGFDFYSAHLKVKLNAVIESLAIGDFIARSGQGLVLWQGFSLGKSIYTANIYKPGQGIRAYTSTDENRFFRGVATSLKLGDTDFSIFISKKSSDGNRMISDSLGDYFTSWQASGYHRTAAEMADKNCIGDLNTGFLVRWQRRNLKLGGVYYFRQAELPLLPAKQLYNRFEFSGRRNYAAGADYLFSKGKYQLFGEAAVSKSGGKAVLQGVTACLHDRLQLSVLFRHFDKDYQAEWSAPFAESSSASNETGCYLGTRIFPVKFVILSAYSDLYRSQWINYTTAGPSSGWEVFTQADFHLSDQFQFYIRYKNEEKDRKTRRNEKNENSRELVRKTRLHVQYAAAHGILLKTRVEHVYYAGRESENGVMIFQDVGFTPGRFPLNLTARVAWFNTGSYNSRIYAYENDLLYAFAIPAYFGNGLRAYINLKAGVTKNAEIWFKLANTLQNKAQSIGSGYNEIPGNQKTEVKIQLRVKI